MTKVGLIVLVWMGVLIHQSIQDLWAQECASFNKTGLEVDLENRLFGQHLASRIIWKAINDFMKNDNPPKPLVLSLHGSSGTGKNFVSKMIAENLYKEGMKSNFVHLFTATLHFPHKSQVETYKSQLQQWIEGNITNCERSMFIFDEMDKMHPGLIDSIKPYVDFYDKINSVSTQKSIFVFLSNGEGKIIDQITLDFWRAGYSREEIELKDVEPTVSRIVFTGQTGLGGTDLIDKNLVDYFVPFLPLEKKHGVQCALAEMKAKGLEPNESIAKQVADDLTYQPKSVGLFSVTGCKRIASRLAYFLEDAN